MYTSKTRTIPIPETKRLLMRYLNNLPYSWMTCKTYEWKRMVTMMRPLTGKLHSKVKILRSMKKYVI